MGKIDSNTLQEELRDNQKVLPSDYDECFAIAPETIKTSKGLVEYAMVGEGPLVLISHGGPGGYDQALVIGELFRKNGFKVLAPSRPGHLGTPVASGKTAEAQGDLHAALMDALGIDSAIVVGVSGGGPSAYQIAERHAHKVSALVVIDGISRHYTKGDDVSRLEKWMYLSTVGQWVTGFFFKHFPSTAIEEFLKTESLLEKHEIADRLKEILADESKFSMMNSLFKTMSGRFSERRDGAENDLYLGKLIDKLPLGSVTSPTLLIHGDADNDVPLGDADYAHDAIGNSDLLLVNGGSHIGFWTAPDAYRVQRYLLDWLKDK